MGKSYGNGRFDVWVWVVISQFEVLILEVEDALHVGVDFHLRQMARLASQLQLRLLNVVEVEVGVASRIDKIAQLEVAHLCHHHRQQGIRSDVERHAKEGVGAALVELATQFAIRHIELEEDVARRQIHVADVRHVPR